MSNKLVLVEFKEEVEYFLKNQPDVFGGGTKVLSLLPEASEALLNNGITFETSVPYFPASSHERCLECVDAIIDEVNSTMRINDANGIRNAYTNALTFYLRQYISYIVSTIEILANFCAAHAIKEIHVGCYLDNDHSQWTMGPKERILGEIARLFDPQVRIAPAALNIPPEARVKRMRKWLRSLLSAVYFPIELTLARKRSRPALAYYSYKYRFDTVAKAFKHYDHYNVAPDMRSMFHLSDDTSGFGSHNVHLGAMFSKADHDFVSSWTGSVELFKTASGKKQLCQWRGYDFSSMVFRKFDRGYWPQMAQLNRTIRPLRDFFRTVKPAAVLSHVARDFSYALGELAERMNIPSILISHGSHVPPKNSFDSMEWFDHAKGLVHTDYRFHLLQSPWAVEHVRAMGYQGNYYAIEPLIFPKVDRSKKTALQLKMFPLSEGKKIVVHAGTPKPRGSNRFYIYETLDEYVAYMSDLIEEARKITEMFLIIRFRPYPYLSTAQLKALLPKGDHYVIASEGSFADYLKIMDLLVSFSSTTIEEALINGIPVVQYDPSGRYVHIQGPAWQDKGFAHVDSVYYIGERRGLGSGLKWILENHLNTTTVGDLFERHVFKQGEAMTIQEFIERLIKGSLPKPIDLKTKPHLDGLEIY